MEGRNFSPSAKLSLSAWTLLLARLVTGSHWPMGWTRDNVSTYLDMLGRFMGILINGDICRFGKKSLLREMADEFYEICVNYSYEQSF